MHTTLLALVSALSLVSAHPVSWYHEADSPIASLFIKRDASPDDPNFASAYPPGWQTPPTDTLPKAWTDKLASIDMPDIDPASPNNGYPTYTGGEKGNDEHICSFTYQCSTADDLVNPPDGVLALSFDDGPTASSPELYSFLADNKLSDKATHFMIGGNIVGNPKGMQAAAQAGGHIAVHTWSHQYTTTLTNEQVLGELGWTMQIIADLNGGRIPKFWRPPYGDVDNRVRAIAKGVFGLETVPWNNDSGDWAISTGQYTRQGVDAEMEGWLTGSKSPGLNILEHELNDNTVNVFMDSYPKMISNGWTIKSVADAWGMQWYQNSGSNTDAVVSMAVAGGPISAASGVSMASMSANGTSLASRSESLTSSGAGSAGAESVTKSGGGVGGASTTSMSAVSGSRTAAAQGLASASASASGKTGGAGMVKPGFALACVGVVAAVLI